MQSHTSHSIHTLHQLYVFLSEIRMQSEKGSRTLITASERPSGRKKVIQTNRSFQKSQIPISWQLSVKPGESLKKPLCGKI